jgi:hypothetical protein
LNLIRYTYSLALSWIRQLVTGLLTRRAGFDPWLVQVGFVVNEVAIRHAFLQSFSLSVSLQQCPVHIESSKLNDATVKILWMWTESLPLAHKYHSILNQDVPSRNKRQKTWLQVT